MTDTTRPKRVRLTDGRVKRWMAFQREISSIWHAAIRNAKPTQVVFSSVSERIKTLDVTAECKRDLHARNWGARDLCEREHAEWVLYYDGKPTTPEQRTQLYADGRHKDLRGRFEWRGTGKPYYDAEDPQLLWGQS